MKLSVDLEIDVMPNGELMVYSGDEPIDAFSKKDLIDSMVKNAVYCEQFNFKDMIDLGEELIRVAKENMR